MFAYNDKAELDPGAHTSQQTLCKSELNHLFAHLRRGCPRSWYVWKDSGGVRGTTETYGQSQLSLYSNASG